MLPVTLNVHVTPAVNTPWLTLSVAWFLVAWNEALASTFCLALASVHVTIHEKSTFVLLTQGATWQDKKMNENHRQNSSVLI